MVLRAGNVKCVNVKPLAAVHCAAGVLIVLSSWLDLTESFLPAENFLFSIHGFCIWEILYVISLKKVMCNQQLLIIYPPMSYFQKTADTGMQLLHQKSSDTAAAVSVAGGNEKTLFFGVHDIGSMSTPNRRHRSLAPFWILEGILERLIEGVKAAVKPHVILLPPLKDSYWICVTGLFPVFDLLTHLNPATSAVYFRTLRFLLVTLSRSHPHRNSVGC